jgi:DNA repair protein RadC
MSSASAHFRKLSVHTGQVGVKLINQYYLNLIMRIRDITAENRPRERLLRQGVSVLSDAELLAILLQNGCAGENVIDLSNRLISSYGVEKLNTLSAIELMKIKSIGEAKACKIIAAFEINNAVVGNEKDIFFFIYK